MEQFSNPNAKRLESIDLLRGIIMVIMALDHTRDFFHIGGFTGNPLDPATTTPVLFFTRWITHLCAPTFVFLSGLSAWLQGQRKSKKDLSVFLLKRGLWLILADLTIMSFVLTFDVYYDLFVLETLWAIGAGMFILGCMLRLPFKVILTVGLIILFGHNALDFAERARAGNTPLWWKFLHQPGIAPLWANHTLFIYYPFLSWAGLTLLGYCCGKLFTGVEAPQRRKILLATGVGAIVLFILLRTLNVYGDPVPWTQQKTSLATFFSFMNVQKYPPSLLYLGATVGPVLIFLALVKYTNSKWQNSISVYGRVPFFYFVVHFFILHLATAVLYLSRGHSVAEGMKGAPGVPFRFVMPGEGYNLFTVYLIWVAIVVFMYPLCVWYDGYKKAHREKWVLSYL